MLSSFFKKTILLSTIIILVLGYNIWPFVWHGFFYQASAISWVLLFLLIKKGINGDIWFKVIANICFWFAVNNLIDELFFDPKVFSWNEYGFAIIIIITNIRIIKRNGKS